MSNDFANLLDATIHYLQELQKNGTNYVCLEPDTLEQLSKPLKAHPKKTYTMPSEKTKNNVLREKTSINRGALNSVYGQTSANPTLQKPSLANGIKTEIGNITQTPEMTPQQKVAALAQLRELVVSCKKCPHLVSFRHTVVFGVGNPNAELMFVGEAPGEDEDLQGEPFVGRAGQLLTKIIQTMGLSRDIVYIGNILKCRPNVETKTGNRPPTIQEMKTCIPYLHQQIEIIKPKVIVALGATAVEGLLGQKVQITKFRGNWQEFRGIPVMPTYHPSYLLRNQNITVKREVWTDMLKVMEKLGMAISEKQRNYFTKTSAI